MRHVFKWYLALFLNFSIDLCLCTFNLAHAEQNRTSSILSNGDQIEILQVYIDCVSCDFDYIRHEINFVNFVRDPYLAQVHVLITYQSTASGGRKYSLRLLGRGKFDNVDQTLIYTALQSDTEDIIRQGLVRILKMGLMPYISQTKIASMLDIRYDKARTASLRDQAPDNWQYWVFHIDLQGGIEAEESQRDLEIGVSLRAERITDIWKIKSEVDYEYQQEDFKDEDEKITGRRKEWEVDVELVKSLNAHWSAGLFGAYQSSTYKNIYYHVGLAPGIEYNFFPWQESDHRIFSISYSAGVRAFQYDEMTLYNKTRETLAYGRIRLELGIIQHWGEIDASVENSHYYFDLSKNLLTLETDLSLRITKGLAFKVDLEAESVHDQLYLPKGDATLEEILLRQKKLATTYDVSLMVGLRYSFGSIYNNIVNRRF
ncbi:DUF481 domain-containing protein [candidate division KSB1 bacterium]|nr:DUF481 domain-containing protein [candidate division KSB1 bacterium]